LSSLFDNFHFPLVISLFVSQRIQHSYLVGLGSGLRLLRVVSLPGVIQQILSICVLVRIFGFISAVFDFHEGGFCKLNHYFLLLILTIPSCKIESPLSIKIIDFSSPH